MLTAVVALSKGLSAGIGAIFFVQLPRYGIAWLPPPIGMQRGLEPQAILGFIEIKIPALIRVVLPLCVAQANPPLLTRGIDRLRAGARQFSTGILCYLFIVSKG